MRSALAAGFALSTAAALMLLTGCSTTHSEFEPPAPPTLRAVPSALNPRSGLFDELDALYQSASKPFVMANGAMSVVRTGTPTDSYPAWMRIATSDASSLGKAYVAAFSSGSTGLPALLYALGNRMNAGPICSTPESVNGVNSIAVDRSNNLWVPEQNNGGLGTGVLQEFGPKCGAAGFNIQIPTAAPADVAFDSKGNIYVGNIVDFDPSGNQMSGTVSAYAPDGTFIGTLTDPSFTAIGGGTLILTGIGVDAKDNCYVSHYDQTGAGEVVKFPGCRPSSKGVVLAGPHPWSPGKPQFDAAGNLLEGDFAFIYLYRIENVGIFAPPFDRPAMKLLPLLGPAVSCPLNHEENRLYCADFITSAIDVYSYPRGRYLYSFNNGVPSGTQAIATVPAAPN